jgi:cyclophilin family peptidyl-prolyl cis-trans isomerase
MASRKQRIKDKRSEEEKQIQQVRMAVGIIIAIIVIAIGIFIANDSGVFAPATEATVSSANLELTGTLDEICEQATPAVTPENREFPAAEQVLEEGVDYQAVMCSDVGAIYIELFEDQTPITVNNLVFLAQNGYYNNSIFHRVIEDFMAQGGDPTGTGRGGPGYQFQDEFLPDLGFDRSYLLAMANSGPGTNGSQFFITFAPTPWLDGKHTIYGEVIAGQDIVDSIVLRDPSNPSAPATALQTVVIVQPEDVQQQ